MSAGRPDRLFDLLPAVYRVSDAAHGDVLRALLGVIQEEFDRVESDVERLYDNWFIETCDEWVVPYIGDLLGVDGLLPTQAGVFSQRAFVANTLAYRRAKGTAAVLEQLARDVTGWPAKAVEYFDLLATTRAMNHARRSDVTTFEVRDANAAELVGSPLERAAHSVEVRRIASGRGRYNIPNVGLHLWRLQPYYLVQATARPLGPDQGGGEHFSFHPVGLAASLFNVPREETALTQLAAEANVPGRLRRRPLHDELEARRRSKAARDQPEELFFDDRQPVVRVWVEQDDGDGPYMRALEPEELAICNLSMPHPAPARSGIRAAVDPVAGRLALPASRPSAKVEVTYAYGFPGDLGGGPYPRRESVADVLDGQEVDWQIGVTQDRPAGADELTTSLGDAVARWNARPAGETGVIAVLDSRTYDEDLDIQVKANSRLLLVAADWPFDLQRDDQGREQRSRGRLNPDGRRPHVRGAIRVHGTAPAGAGPGMLAIDGLLVEGRLAVLPGNLGELRLAHSTLVPPRGRLRVRSRDHPGQENNQLAVTVLRSITGPLLVDPRVAGLAVEASIVDGGGRAAVVSPETEIVASTVLGCTAVRSLSASNSIFTDLVTAERRQTGCVRYTFLPPGSKVARRFRCQPADDTVAAHVAPSFTSSRYGDPAYGQLAASCPAEITQGADDEGELGAFHFLQQGRRVAGLTTRLEEYLRFGLEAGVFFVT